jgi:hypothetical protein
MSATWFNSAEKAPQSTTQFHVRNELAGPEFIARYNGPGQPWTIISFKEGVVPSCWPKYWLKK